MGRGGSRCGAGRPAYRAKAEQLQRVEIGRWHRGGYLRAGSYFSWSWNRGGKPTGSIGVLMHGEHSLALRYNITGDDGAAARCQPDYPARPYRLQLRQHPAVVPMPGL